MSCHLVPSWERGNDGNQGKGEYEPMCSTSATSAKEG